MKGVILCAGKGTRMKPFSYSLPKTLLPVANQSVLEHGIRKMMQAGIREIGIVINPSQKKIIEYLATLNLEVSFRLIYQTHPKGIAHALLAAQKFIGDDPFVLLLGDNLISEPLETLLDAFQGQQAAIMLARVDTPKDYGIALIEDRQIVELVEKPKQPKSDLAVIGLYVFSPVIFDGIKQLKPSPRGEYEITDAIQWMIGNQHPVSFTITNKPHSDVGTIDRWISANEWMLQLTLGKDVQIGQDCVLENCVFKAPVQIGDRCTIKNAVIGPHVSIQAESTLIECKIENSICLSKSTILHVEPVISHSVFGRDTYLDGREGVETLQCILGDRSQIKPRSPS